MSRRPLPPALSEAERRLFHAAVADVRPLSQRHQRVDLARPPAYVQLRSEREPPAGPDEAALDWLTDSRLQACTTAQGRPALLHADGARRLLRDLERGHWEVQAQLDLHGYQLEAAHAQLLRFLAHALNEQRRCLLIIHGRGHHSPAAASVLQTLVWQTLRARPEVLACCQAPERLGGAGAVLLLLRAARRCQRPA